jgi:hypothetical protein
LFLQRQHLRIHVAKLLRLLEGIPAAVRRILALEVQIPASLTWCISVALDLPAFALVAAEGSATKNE